MKHLQYILLTVILFPLLGTVSSCSEDSGEEDVYADWQARNDAMTNQWAANSSFTKIKSFTKDETTVGANSDYIYVEKLADSKPAASSDSPLYTDTVRVAYAARLIPTTKYPNGELVDYSFKGDFSWDTSSVMDGASWIDGFSTALMHMHVGDHWRIYVPYQLAYRSSAVSNDPGYSNMIFEVALFDFWHPGETRPIFKARGE